MDEHILVVGSGGREHAITRALRDGIAEKDEDIGLTACMSNRNPGIADLVDSFELLDETDPDAVSEFAASEGVTTAVVGPDDPLAAGVVDALEATGIYAFGPTKRAARIEWDKQYQREFMREEDVPGCPDFEVFDDTAEACEYVRSGGLPVVKPAGLTGGKGVKIIGDQLTREQAVEYLQDQQFDRVVFEEELVGVEFTLQAFVANDSIRYTPAAHDHGRAFEGDEGPNTGGMGSFTAPETTLPFMSNDEYEAAKRIIEETVGALDGFEGVLYGQFMLTADGPKVVEYNARFGDPEAMNTIPALETNFVDIVLAAKRGEQLPELEFSSMATVCKYAVPEGYPTDPNGGTPIEPLPSDDDRLLYYGSVDEVDGAIRTTTSRSFAYVGVGESIEAAERAVSEAFEETDLTGLRVRHDIGTADLVQQRIETMDGLTSGRTE